MRIYKKLPNQPNNIAAVRLAEFVYEADGPSFIILKQRTGDKLGQKLTPYELEKEIALNINYDATKPKKSKPK